MGLKRIYFHSQQNAGEKIPEEDKADSSGDTNPKQPKRVLILHPGNQSRAKSSSSGEELPDIQDQQRRGTEQEECPIPQAEPQPDPQPGRSGHLKDTPNKGVTR